MKIDQVYIDTDEVVVGFDPERADMSNPDGAAGDGCVARLVRCSSFVDLLPVFAGWVILLVTLALMLAGVGQFFGWWDIDMRRHWMTPPTKSPKAQSGQFFGWWDIDMRRQTAQDEVADFAEASDPGCDY